MRIEEYFHHIDETINLCPSVSLKTVFYDQRSETMGFIRGLLHCEDGSKLHLWISLDNRILKDDEVDAVEPISHKLGGKPQAHIVLAVSRTAGSERLAVAFASACVDRWPCVVYNMRDKVFAARDGLRLCQAGMGFEE